MDPCVSLLRVAPAIGRRPSRLGAGAAQARPPPKDSNPIARAEAGRGPAGCARIARAWEGSMTTMVRGVPAVMVVIALLVGALAAPSAAQGPLRIRIGWVVAPAQLTPLLFQKQEILKHHGKSYVVEPVHFRGSTPQITALAAGELEIAALAYSSFPLAVHNAKLDLRVVADVFQDGVPGHYSSEYLVAGDSPIRSAAELRGKRVATNAIGGAVDIGARAMLKKHGLEDKRDYTILEVGFPNMTAMVREGKVDAAGFVVPFAISAKEAGLRPLFVMRDAVGVTQMLVWAARADFLARHRPALVDFFEDHQRALRWFLDPANREAAIAMVAAFTKRPAESYRPWLFTAQDYYRHPQGLPDLEALQRNIATAHELGFLPRTLDVKAYSDLSLLQEAAQRLR